MDPRYDQFYSRFPASGYGSGAPPYVMDYTTGGGGYYRPASNDVWGKVGEIGKSIGSWITKHPDTVATIAGTAASVYGAGKDRALAEKQMNTENQQWQQDYALRQRDQAMREMEAQRQLQADVAERMRRRAAIGQVLGIYQQAKTKYAAAGPVQME